ncbi:glycosyltransferase family 2 protein [Aquamicrobium defluvii]|uniref:Glycosyl transferase family 2 n=1 Tax=Aquamicrobium defluvii TaxID=69279 RepID=A0A4R6YH27_9HYPH|nr:glycosyltransferase family 2 protein [Aquamicrobium defluvii]TDR35685.1 glycosyl transferase family 2 [Aquamicrobium defluvii]
MGDIKSINYPDPLQQSDLSRLTTLEMLRCDWDARRVLSRRRREDKELGYVRIYLLGGGPVRPLTGNDLPLIFLTHNDRRFVRSFLAHYRALGVTRFICVDDASADGTREALLAEPDVDVFGSTVRYRDARRGRIWRELLFAIYGPDRWYLNVDSDEYLVYEDCDHRTLPDLIEALERRGIERCPAPMLDAYPPGTIAAATFEGLDDIMPWQVASSIDGGGYRLTKERRALSLAGGMRERVFDAGLELMKYPLIYWRQGYSLGVSIHQPLPYRHNFAPIFGALLHFKFFNDAASMARKAIADQQYFNNAQAYNAIAQVLDTSDEVSFISPQSFSYAGPNDLIDRGFMQSPFLFSGS